MNDCDPSFDRCVSSAPLSSSNPTTNSTSTNQEYEEGLLACIIFFLIVICSILIMWFKYGGRIAFHRNERGWMIGLRHIPPVLPPAVSDRMTKEQVLSLPEISFRATKIEGFEATRNVDLESLNSRTISKEGRKSKNCEFLRPMGPASIAPAVVDTDKILSDCECNTECAICMENFYQGEMIRLLPKCGHCMHTKCIIPWLTEGRGICPL
jgi:hypothetical protein